MLLLSLDEITFLKIAIVIEYLCLKKKDDQNLLSQNSMIEPSNVDASNEEQALWEVIQKYIFKL